MNTNSHVKSISKEELEEKKEARISLLKIIFSFFFLVLFHFLPIHSAPVLFLLYLIPYLIVGGQVLVEAASDILHGGVFSENFLMAVASIGAFCLGQYVESASVMLFFAIGELFEDYAVGKSRRNIKDLMDIRPDIAHWEHDGKTESVDPAVIPVGSQILVQPGEKIPLDGVITDGTSSLDAAALTGESIPRSVAAGDTVLSGSINLSGVLHIQTTKAFSESTASKILDLVENAATHKSRSENFITKFARYYTPAVCFSALLLAVLPPFIRIFILHAAPLWNIWIYRALTFLVISCPCALVISIPLSFFAGIGGAGNQGILIKGSNYMETLANVKTVVFDKTGTITRGNFEVTGIHHNTMESEQLLLYVSLIESFSSHPISKSLQRACHQPLDASRVTDLEEFSGYGISGKVDGLPVSAGNSRFMHRLGISCLDCHSIGTIVHVAVNGTYAGHIVISDELKPHAKEAVCRLHHAGITKTVMLTGDTAATARAVANDVGITDVYAELLPGDKVQKVETLLSEKKPAEALAFVGDGINDAPVLTRADIGIAMGALGSDAAIEAADVVLMDDDPLKISKAIAIAKKCMRIVYENITFAITIKLLCLLLGAFGIANMWMAIFADVGVMILAVLNAIRVLFVKNLK